MGSAVLRVGRPKNFFAVFLLACLCKAPKIGALKKTNTPNSQCFRDGVTLPEQKRVREAADWHGLPNKLPRQKELPLRIRVFWVHVILRQDDCQNMEQTCCSFWLRSKVSRAPSNKHPAGEQQYTLPPININMQPDRGSWKTICRLKFKGTGSRTSGSM